MDKAQWYENKTIVYVLLVFFFPVGLYGLWKSSAFTKNVKIVLSSILTVLVLIALLSDDKSNKSSSSNQSKSTTESKQEDKEKQNKVGDKISTGKFEIKVLSASPRYVVGSEYFNQKPSEGALFIAVQIQFKNITTEPLSSFTNPSIKLIDPNGTKYDADHGASAYFATEANINKKILSKLNPGITVRDAEVFEVSKELWSKKGWKLLIDADEEVKVNVN